MKSLLRIEPVLSISKLNNTGKWTPLPSAYWPKCLRNLPTKELRPFKLSIIPISHNRWMIIVNRKTKSFSWKRRKVTLPVTLLSWPLLTTLESRSNWLRKILALTSWWVNRTSSLAKSRQSLRHQAPTTALILKCRAYKCLKSVNST